MLLTSVHSRYFIQTPNIQPQITSLCDQRVVFSNGGGGEDGTYFISRFRPENSY